MLAMGGCSEPADEAPAPEAGAVPEDEAAPARVDPQALTANNRGVGLMGKFEYAAAREAFAEVVARQPGWLDAKVNLAIATLNRQEQGDEAGALVMVDAVIAEDLGQLRAHYVAGLLRLYLGDPAAATAHFRRVAEADPEDAYAAYFLGQCLAQQSEFQAALAQYRKALALDPYLRSAAYGLFQALRRTGQTDEARAVMADYQRLEKNPRARLAEFKYTRMGPKAEALAFDRPAPAPEVASPPDGPLFAAPVVLLPYAVPRADRPYSVTVVDLQGDGQLDVFLAGVGPEGGNLILIGTGDHAHRLEADHPLAPITAVNAVLWGDYDNDGLVDVYLCRKGANQLWRQSPPGQWTDVTQASATAGGAFDTRGGAFFDADHDGDLDLYLVNADGPNALLSNNLDGSFRPIAAEQGIAGDGGGSRQVVPVDLDGDRDLDLVVVNSDPPHDIYMNDRLWRYHPVEGLRAFRAGPALAMVAGDADADGVPELFTVGPAGSITRWQLGEAGEYAAQTLAQPPLEGHWAQLALADADGDGRLDLWLVSPSGWSVLDPLDGSELMHASPGEMGAIVGASPMLWRAGAGPGVVAVQVGRGVIAWPPGPGRHPFLAVSLSGRTSMAESMRSNASGLGAHVALRVDSRWTLATTLDRHSGPGQSLQPLALGLGGAQRADFVAIDWSDGVFQSELDLASGTLHAITETQRQLSSCPVLFAWDGQRWAFVSDFLGVGGIGYAIGPGEYATPRPWENVLLPDGSLQPQGGLLRLKVTEPMEEVAYLDSARLVAYDLPPDWRLVLDERMATGEPQATGEARFYRHELLPEAAINDRGQDVTTALAQADGKAVPVGPLDRRFIGRLAAEHVLTLAFPQPLDDQSGAPMLVADGWVEYPYSQTQFAAWQAGAHYQAPSIEARGADGRWHTVLSEFGYPAGMPRRMSVPLVDLPVGTRALRIRSNMEVYWDRIAIAFAEPPPPAERTVLALQSARQAQVGFPRWSVGTQRWPSYDYARRRPFWDTRYPAGFYTRLGPVNELVETIDDAVAVIAPGDEVDLAFTAPPGPVPAGWTRWYVLETHGWAKDMDLFTRDGDTVAPMPSTGRPVGPRDALHARYLTRYLAGR